VIDTYSERAGGITGGRPAGTPVKTHTLIRDDLEEATATEGLGVGLTLNLQDIQREQDDLANTNQTGMSVSLSRLSIMNPGMLFSPASSGVHDGLSSSLAKSLVEIGAVVLSQVVPSEGLATVLVNALKDLEMDISGLHIVQTGVHIVKNDQPCSQRHSRDRGTAK